MKGLPRLSPTPARSLLAAGGRILGGTTFFCQPLRWSDSTLNQGVCSRCLTNAAASTYVVLLHRLVTWACTMMAGDRNPHRPSASVQCSYKQGLWHLRQVSMGWHVLELEEVLKDVGFEQTRSRHATLTGGTTYPSSSRTRSWEPSSWRPLAIAGQAERIKEKPSGRNEVRVL